MFFGCKIDDFKLAGLVFYKKIGYILSYYIFFQLCIQNQIDDSVCIA